MAARIKLNTKGQKMRGAIERLFSMRRFLREATPRVNVKALRHDQLIEREPAAAVENEPDRHREKREVRLDAVAFSGR